MNHIVQILGLAGQVESRPDLDATRFRDVYLKSYDPEAHDGRGDLVATRDVREAQRFASPGEAMELVDRQPAARPWRGDGEPNRPARAFSLAIVPEPQ